MARVTLRGLCKEYGGTHVLHPLDLEIEDGAFVVVLGPSGSGKSTMLKLVAGIENASGGSVSFDDRDVTQTPPERRDVSMVFQSYALYPTMRVFDNIAFPLKLRRVPADQIRTSVQETADLLGIGGLLKRRPRELSGGERQRVALARAMVRRPAVFLFDEPLSNLDAHLRSGTRQELKQLHRMLGATFIYVTHDQDDALDMGDQIVVLRNGHLEQCATSGELYAAPANRFIASFVGHPPMNLLEGALVRDRGTATFRAKGMEIGLGSCADGMEEGRTVLGIRPEALSARPHEPDDPIAGTVESISALGFGRIYATLRIGESMVRTRLREGTPEPAIGALAGVDGDASQAHLFDPGDGRCLSRGNGAVAPRV